MFYFKYIYKKFFTLSFIIIMFSSSLLAVPVFTVNLIPDNIKNKLISHRLWSNSCPVNIDDLRLLTISYFDFSGRAHNDGELIVNKKASEQTINLFQKLYEKHFPFSAVNTLLDYRSDWQFATKQNASFGFFCQINNDRTFSPESFGNVITINPVLNPEYSITKVSIKPKSFFCSLFSSSASCKKDEKLVTRVVMYPKESFASLNRLDNKSGMIDPFMPLLKKNGFEKLPRIGNYLYLDKIIYRGPKSKEETKQ